MSAREDAAFAAIRAKCLECSGGSRKQAHGCNLKECPLWPYRKGPPRNAPAKKCRREGEQLSMFDHGRGQ